MSENNKKNIPIEEVPLIFKSVKVSNDVRVLIVGGGSAAGIKYRSFDNKSFKIDIYADEITDKSILIGIEDRDIESSNKLLKRVQRLEKYEDIHFSNYGIIVIATDNKNLNEEVRQKCIAENKLFIYCPDFKKGNISVPMEIETESLTASMGTKAGSPETARYISKKIESLLREHDEFVTYVGKIREVSKCRDEDSSRRKEIMKFMNSDDFYFFFNKGKADIILRMFYGDDYIENNSWD